MGDALRKSTRSETTGATAAMGGGGDDADAAGEQRTSTDGSAVEFPKPRGDVLDSASFFGGVGRRCSGVARGVGGLGQAVLDLPTGSNAA